MSVGAGARDALSLFRVRRGAFWLSGLIILLGGITTLFEGAGIILILPFLQKLIHGSQAVFAVTVPNMPRVERWINAVPVARQLPLIGALIFLAILFREAVAYLATLLKTRLSMRIADVFRGELHDALISAQLRAVARYHFGYCQNLLHIEANRLRSVVLQVLTLGEMLVIAGTVLAIMALISAPLTGLVLALLIVVGLPLTGFFRWIHRTGLGRMESRTTLNNYLAELMPFLASVHVFNGQARERRRFANRYLEMFRQDMRLERVARLIGPVYHLVGVLGVLGVALLAVFLSRADLGAAGWVIPFILLFSRLLPIMNGMNHALATLNDGLVSYRKFAGEIEFLRGHGMGEGAREFPPEFQAIELSGVWFTYDGTTPVLRDLSLTVRRGGYVALTGPSGSGKSTLCLLLCRLHDPTKGEILVDGAALTEFRLASLRRAITIVEQAPVLLNDTIRANIAYGNPEATEEDVRRALRQANADGFIDELPGGYNANVGNLGAALSGGQRQRIVLARALLRRPQILILDEATSAVDARSEFLIKQAIEALRGDTTVISVAHRLSTIKDADLIHFVRDGRIVASGTFAELLARSRDFGEYVRAQELSAEAEVSR